MDKLFGYERRSWTYGGVDHYEKRLTSPLFRQFFESKLAFDISRNKIYIGMLAIIAGWSLTILLRIRNNTTPFTNLELIAFSIPLILIVLTLLAIVLRRTRIEVRAIPLITENLWKSIALRMRIASELVWNWRRDIGILFGIIMSITGLIYYPKTAIVIISLFFLGKHIREGLKVDNPLRNKTLITYKAEVHPLAFWGLALENMGLFKDSWDKENGRGSYIKTPESELEKMAFWKKIIRGIFFPPWIIVWRLIGWKHVGYGINSLGKFIMCERMSWNLFKGLELETPNFPVQSLVMVSLRPSHPIGGTRVQADYQAELRDVYCDPKWLLGHGLITKISELQQED